MAMQFVKGTTEEIYTVKEEKDGCSCVETDVRWAV